MLHFIHRLRTDPKLPFRRHFVLFTILTLFAVAQLTWWIVFQLHEGKRVTATQQNFWFQQQQIATDRLTTQGATPEFDRWLAHFYPDLGRSGEIIVVRADAWRRLDELAGGRMRMFIGEGVFFALLLLVGVLYMYRTLQEEIAVEHRQTVFLSATSHELKTPITSIRLYLDTISSRELPAEKRGELLSRMSTDLDRLNDLIERLLLAQAVVNPARRLELSPLDVSEETQRVMEEIQRRLDRKKFTLNVDLDYGLVALADGDRWQLVVKNLVDNALKYSPQGGSIDVYLTSDKGTIRLAVTDTGTGFAAEERDRIFERFYRIGSEDTRQTKGTGLGLYLVREIADSFGGRAYAESPGIGQGSTFSVELPEYHEVTS
jgi:signal transduction histidine kinase